jgi:hypothetical protein
MDATELRDFIREHFTRTAFRLETLQQYEVASDGNDFGRYLAGEAAPTPERKRPWLDRLRNERDRGLHRSRVRIVTHPITDYTRYECEWGYLPNAEAGEDIRILDMGENNLMRMGWLAQSDWWLIDDGHLIQMHYAPTTGEFWGASLRPDYVKQARAARDQAWETSEPFAAWWERHDELHRDHRRAA